ncbi:MAG: SCO family protein [Chloroflexota bacterium]|nr:SCO family protein [Chloroflexota bacterium]
MLDKSLFIAALLMTACATAAPATPTAVPPMPRAEVYVGERVEPAVQVQDFTLPSSTGELMNLSDLNGRWRVVFFGYLHCPDVCPLTMVEYRAVKRLLDDAAEQVEFVYISVDGARDTPEALRDYLDNFDPEFIGLSADDDTLARIQPDYGFYYRRQLNAGDNAIYTIDHSARSYLLDPDGRLRTMFNYGTQPEIVAAAIQWWVSSR